MPKTNGRKRQSPSVERQLALALVALLEDISVIHIGEVVSGTENSDRAAREVLKANGYEDLESIPKRVGRIEGLIEQAYEKKEFSKIARLAVELERAKKGLPPLATEKKPRKAKTPKVAPTDPPAEPKEKRARKKKGDKSADLPLDEGVPVKCANCDWTGVAVIGSACPVDGYLVVTE